MSDQHTFSPYEMERRYREEYYGFYRDFADRLKGLLIELTQDFRSAIDKIECRAKTPESFLEKLERKSYKYQNPFAEITDLTGGRVITFYQDSVPRIVEIIRREFAIDEENSFDKSAALKVEEFGYRSIHLVVTLSESRVALGEWKRFAGIKFEIQVRSILQHAWANMSHKFDYKVTSQAPRDLQRKLFRLSALLELADEEFKTLLDQSEAISEEYRSDVRSGKLDIPLDLDSLREFIHEKVDLPKWEQLGLDVGMEHFSDRDVARKYFQTSLETLLLTLQEVGITTVAEFERLEHGLQEITGVLDRFVQRIHAKGESVHSLSLEVLILLVSFAKASAISPHFEWGKRYKPFYIEALRDTLCEPPKE
jgi:ppGpp synthetase/RelA/SpoT-type nucleotidyltranferase